SVVGCLSRGQRNQDRRSAVALTSAQEADFQRLVGAIWKDMLDPLPRDALAGFLGENGGRPNWARYMRLGVAREGERQQNNIFTYDLVESRRGDEPPGVRLREGISRDIRPSAFTEGPLPDECILELYSSGELVGFFTSKKGVLAEVT